MFIGIAVDLFEGSMQLETLEGRPVSLCEFSIAFPQIIQSGILSGYVSFFLSFDVLVIHNFVFNSFDVSHKH
jgi:hypothetical protein